MSAVQNDRLSVDEHRVNSLRILVGSLEGGLVDDRLEIEDDNIGCLADLESSAVGKSQLPGRSEEHTSELQSLVNLVCRLLLYKKKKCLVIMNS